MSTVISKNVQIGADATPSNNFTWYQPSTPDGTVRLGSGNSGSVTDILSVSSSGLTLSGLTLSSGTANGVAYLNGSKVLTTGSALTFDGTNLGIGTSSPDAKLVVYGAAGSNPYSHFKDASGADFFIQSVGNSDCRTGTASNHPWLMYTNGTERARIDSSGNFGLGVTPSAWSVGKAIQVGNGMNLWDGNGNSSSVQLNCYYNAGHIYQATGFASRYVQTSGQHQWYTAPSGTAGNAISFTQAMTLDASGNLGIGTSSPTERLNVYKASSNVRIRSDADANYSASLTLASQGREAYVYNYNGELNLYNSYASGNLVFYTNSTERARIDSSGNLLVGTTNGIGKLAVATASGTGSTSSWDNGYFTVAPGGTSTSTGIALSVNTANETTQISSLTPGISWRDIIYKAEKHIWHYSGNSEAARIDSSGTFILNSAGGLKLTQPAGSYTIDTGTTNYYVANGGYIDFPSCSGMLIVNNHGTGYISAWLCGSGGTTNFSAIGSCGTLAHNGSIGGYRWTNNTGSASYFGCMFFRTRNTA